MDLSTLGASLNTIHTKVETLENNDLTDIHEKLDSIVGVGVTLGASLNTIHTKVETLENNDLSILDAKLDSIIIDGAGSLDLSALESKLDVIATQVDSTESFDTIASYLETQISVTMVDDKLSFGGFTTVPIIRYG